MCLKPSRLRLISIYSKFSLGFASLLPLVGSAQLPLQQDDTVCIIGNGLADRMQHDGWVETLIQSEMADKKLSFRNLAFTGDTVTKRPRSKGFTSPEDYLKHCKADVIFVFFGYNESFGGESQVANFKSDLSKMIDSYRLAKFNSESAPRIVLFSPIAHEDLNSPFLPSGNENNVNLALYTGAIKQVADEKNVGFVDLFAPSQALYGKSDMPLTLNGVHLLPEGNKKIGEVIASALSGKQVTASDKLEPLREAVMDKNWHWHNRYRATDGNDIWGGRSGLKFVKGQTNKEVLEHELTMLDVMTANRDPNIWATAKGQSYKIDDSNVPAPVEVISNVGGKSKSSSAAKEGSAEYMGGKEAISKMHIPDGFEVNLFADEEMFPALANPVQLQVDSKGRMWAACWSTYPKWEPLKEMTDSLLILPDENRDGIADKAIEFAKIHNPLGFEFYAGGVIVASQPDIFFLKDTDGDDVADLKIVLVQGIGSSDTHHSANNFIIGPDGALYWQSGIFLQNNFEHPWGPSLVSTKSAMYRFDPRSYAITFHADNRPNPHGTSFDYWGYHFANDGTGGKSFQVRPSGDGFKMFPLVNKEVRPVPADAIVSSSNFPDEFQQDFLVCNTIGYLGIKRYELDREGGEAAKKKGYGFGEIWGEPTKSFFYSDDKNFRPTDAEFGSDGALYIADWQNIIIGHMQHNIRDPKRDKKHGRIYRMVYKDRPLQEPVPIDGLPVAKLLDNLKHPIDGVRHRTRIELSEHTRQEVISATDEWVKQFDPKKKEDAHHLLEALWVYQRNHVQNKELLQQLLNSPEPHARVAAATVKHYWGPADPTKGKLQTELTDVEEKIEVEIPSHLTGNDAKTYELGAQVYHREAHCATCHQDHGKGMDPYPPLVASEWVTGDEERLVKLTLHGLWGKITVNGKEYDPAKGVPPMTAFSSLLDDKEMAAVLTYVRNSWGNKADPVKPETVKKVRAATSKRSIYWTPEELLKEHPMK